MNALCKKFILDNLNNQKDGAMFDLSKEVLANSDYDFIAEILTKSSYLQTLKLPPLNVNNAEYVLTILNKATVKNSVLTEMNLTLPKETAKKSAANVFLYKQIQSRLTRNRKRIFGIHGGGNIGLGLMADIISKSPFQYQAVGTTSDEFLKCLVNAKQDFLLKHGADKDKITRVKHIHMISRDREDIIKLYQEANLLAICLTPGVVESSMREIANGLINRYRIDGSGLKILLLMNMPNSAEFVKKKIIKEIYLTAKNPVEAQGVIGALELIPGVVDRIVTKIPETRVKAQIRKQLLSCQSNDFIDRSHLQQQIDSLFDNPEKLAEAIVKLDIQFKLFNAESNFAYYVPSGVPEINRFPVIKQVTNLDQLEVIKNKYINGPHAILAWLGAINGCSTIAEAIKYPGVFDIINNIMKHEIAPALKSEFPNLTNNELDFHKNLFIERCLASNDDPVTRVGRDPLRKIESGGRIRGTIELCKKHKLNTSTNGLELGIAAAILYSVNACDATNAECQKIREIYNMNKSFRDVLCFKNPDTNRNVCGFDPDHDKVLINNILKKIYFLEENEQSLQQYLYFNLKEQNKPTLFANTRTMNANLKQDTHYALKHKYK